MNILWITKLNDDTLHKTSEFEMSDELRKKRHTVTIVMAKNIGENKIKNNKIVYLPTADYKIMSGLIFDLFILLYLPIYCWRKKIELIIIDEATVWLPFTITLKICRIPLILDVRTLPIDKKESTPFDIALHFSKVVSDGITTITPELKEILQKKYSLQNKKIGIWTSGVSINKFLPASDINKNIKSLRDSNFFILMYHGSYSTTRGIENLLESLEKLDNELRKYVLLVIIGFSTEDEKKIMILIEKLKVKEQVKFFPKIRYDEIPSYISICDIGVYPLPPDNMWWYVSAPLKTLEYLAMSKPVIVTSIPFHQRIFEKGECGVLLESNNPKDIANAITYLYKHKEKLMDMGKKGREIVEKNHTWEHEAINFEKFLLNIIER